MSTASPKKLVISVHGMGDQVRNEAALATTVRFCDHFRHPGAVALGAFHGAPRAIPVVAFPEGFGDPRLAGGIGFAEVYWADIARKISDQNYTLQETKAWAHAVVNRVRVFATARDASTALDYPRIRLVLEEMIAAIGVLDSLLFLANKAGLTSFSLKKTLDAFLGDVQLVAEFEPVRHDIIARFDEIVSAALKDYPGVDEIYFISHSEGTVVSWLSLLAAVDDPKKYPWIERTRGFMTFGSPIDKHLILWPQIFERHKQPAPRTAPPIQWRNYVDLADPVGFNLNTARGWIEARHYRSAFAFNDADDFSFNRYAVPGKAHIDYWTDAPVYDHFIESVVAPKAAPSPAEMKFLQEGPPSAGFASVKSYLLSFGLPLATLYAGVYLLYKGVSNYVDPDKLGTPYFFRHVVALGILLGGTAIWLRLVRLTGHWLWVVGGGLVYAATAAVFLWILAKEPGHSPELDWLEPLHARSPLSGVHIVLGTLVTCVAVLLRNATSRALRQRAATAAPSESNAAVATSGSLMEFVWIGGAGLGLLALVHEFRSPPGSHGPLWQLLLSILAFLFLWRLSALFFDLMFVWNRYIRHDAALEFLRDKVQRQDLGRGGDSL